MVLAGMTLANAMILVDQTAVPLTLPEIMNAFDVGAATVQWVLTASLLPLAGLLVLGGRLGDLLGRRRIFLVGSVLFAGGSALGGLAPAVPLLLGARVLQGIGGALLLPCSVAIVSATYPSADRGRALGAMGGIAALAGAFGPTIGGGLTSALSWRAVLLVNVPLAAACVLATTRSVPADEAGSERPTVDVGGGVLLCAALVGLVFGLTQTQAETPGSMGVVVPLGVAVLAGVLFVRRERRATNPLMSLALLRRTPNYLGASISQGLAGMAEMGLGVIFPLLLILNLEMSPALAGLALIPSTLPMIVMAPLAGRWYDRAGGRSPLATGFGVLALSGIALVIGVGTGGYLAIMPGLLLYGIGLALVLTVNDPVSLDMVPERDQGQASGVSATAEQGGGAIGIAALYAVFHAAYFDRLGHLIETSPLPDLTPRQSRALDAGLEEAERSGLKPDHFDPEFVGYLELTRDASEFGYMIVFAAVVVIGLVGVFAVLRLVRPPPDSSPDGILEA